MNPQVNPKAQRRGILARVRDVFTIPAHAPPMPGKMKAGLLVLWLLTGFIVLVLGQNLLYLVLSKVSGKEAFLPVFVLFYGFPLPIFMSACLLLVRRGYRAPAILCLLVPVFLFLPPSIIIFTGGILVPLEYFGIIKTSIDSFGQLQNWIVRPLLVAVLIAATPLAFGARAEEWYRQCRPKKTAFPETSAGETAEPAARANGGVQPPQKSGTGPAAPQNADAP